MSTIGNYKILKTLGAGGFSKVFLAKEKDTGELYAIKIMNKSKSMTKEYFTIVK